MKSLVDDLVVTCGEIVDMPETTSVNPTDKINYWFIGAALLVLACLLLLVVIFVKYYVKIIVRLVSR